MIKPLGVSDLVQELIDRVVRYHGSRLLVYVPVEVECYDGPPEKPFLGTKTEYLPVTGFRVEEFERDSGTEKAVVLEVVLPGVLEE